MKKNLLVFLACLAHVTSSSGATLTPITHDPRCYRSTNESGSCIPLTSKFCLNTQLTFDHTSLSLANDSNTLEEVYEKLKLWSGLQNVPQCWAVVQPFLCSVYLPRCDDTLGVELPSQELCERTRKPCQIVYEINNGWPDFLRCDHPNFVSGCGTATYDKLVFNTTGRCEAPLVRTDDAGSWYDGVEGCGVPCDNPLFTAEQHNEVHTFIAVFGSICLVCTLFTVLTFIIDWKNANRYPALILFFINACFFLGSIGWMSQFAGDARRDIVCRRDGTVRKGEPQLGSNESISCTVVFIIVYYFLVAGVSWFVMLAYAWYVTFTALGTSRDALVSKTAYFHLVSWCLPLVLTIICLAISEVDGDSVSGICFVGSFNHSMRALFVLVPVGLVMLVGTFFLLRGVYTLIKIRKEAPVFIPEKTFSKIRDTILRLGIFTAVALIFVLITFAVHVYIFASEDRWKSSFREYMYAEPMKNIWVFHKPSNKPVKLKRHKMIAQAFEKRKEINQGRVSISYLSSHDDPLGMKFDLNSGSDDELSSNFAMAMPNLVRRRGGLIYPSAGMGRRYSDSDVQSSVSTRRVSRESQMMEFREAQFVMIGHDGLPEAGRRTKKKMKKKKRGRLNRIRPVVGPLLNGIRFGNGRLGNLRKGSDSSAISQMSAHSVRVSMERNSIETASLVSNPPDTILPAVTPSREAAASSSRNPNRVGPYLEFGPRKQGTDFTIFSAKNALNHSHHEATGVHGGVGAASSGIQSELSLPGAPDEPPPSPRKAERGAQQQQQQQHQKQHHFHPFQTDSFQQQQNLKWGAQVEDAGLNSSSSEPAMPPPPSGRMGRRKSMAVGTTSKRETLVTVETHQMECGPVPLSSLMADISGGNWGVLLGKSGSSSGSEAGGGGASAYMSGGSGFMGRPHRPPDPYMGMPGGLMGAVGSAFGGGGPNPYMSAPSNHPSAYMGGAGPSYTTAKQRSKPHMGMSGMKANGGARPKVMGDQWGHFPAFSPPQMLLDHRTATQHHDRRWERERRRERELRRPNQAFFNANYNVEDDDLEFIST
ncbi:smoothened homolog [Aplysia californica]|uniref:Smoothened homolog n=1 Tax=Aplysia californica TaxID=6500 RepID=A0ABM1A804_APLCA|nr:smoothened homolog [Aplysia californica]